MSSASESRYTYEQYKETSDWLLCRTHHRPQVALICGSGMGGLVDQLREPVVFPYKDIPHFPQSTVQGHAGQLVFGELHGKVCVCMQGRFHHYEGYSLSTVAFPVRVFALMGVETMIATNMAAGLNPKFSVGDFMVIRDHIGMPGMAGFNHLWGPSDDRFGTHFPCMSDAYDAELGHVVREVAEEQRTSSRLHQGVYCMVGGPSLETLAESRMLLSLGADAVGMSTVPEVLVARQSGLRVLGLSLITKAVVTENGGGQQGANHGESLKMMQQRQADLQTLISQLLVRI